MEIFTNQEVVELLITTTFSTIILLSQDFMKRRMLLNAQKLDYNTLQTNETRQEALSIHKSLNETHRCLDETKDIVRDIRQKIEDMDKKVEDSPR